VTPVTRPKPATVGKVKPARSDAGTLAYTGTHTRSGVGTAISWYKQLAGQYPLLTREEELALAMEIEDGLEAKRLLDEEDSSSIDPAERTALIERQGKGVSAERRLCLSNLRLVISIANKIHQSPNYKSAPISDLVQEGNIGLLQAVRKFDYHKGYRFTTYAYNWVMLAMRDANKAQRMIRLPARASLELSKVAGAREDLMVELGRHPTVAEQAERTGFSVEKVRTLLDARHDATSFDAFSAGDDKKSFTEWYNGQEDDSKNEMENRLLSDDRKRVITEHMLPKLNEKERMAIELKYGLNGNEPMIGTVIAEKLGCSRNSYNKLVATALWRLSSMNQGVAKDLYDTLEH
jgi:RNA polymerase primary sigma factor